MNHFIHETDQSAFQWHSHAVSACDILGAEVSCWMQTGDRQAARLRTKYLESLLRQDVGYFDTDTNTGDFVSSIASDPLMVQDAISEKVDGRFCKSR